MCKWAKPIMLNLYTLLIADDGNIVQHDIGIKRTWIMGYPSKSPSSV